MERDQRQGAHADARADEAGDLTEEPWRPRHAHLGPLIGGVLLLLGGIGLVVMSGSLLSNLGVANGLLLMMAAPVVLLFEALTVPLGLVMLAAGVALFLKGCSAASRSDRAARE